MRQISVKVDADATAWDIESMQALSAKQYAEHIESGLFFVDHHDILRATHGEYPVATTAEQVRALIEHLERVEARMAAAAA